MTNVVYGTGLCSCDFISLMFSDSLCGTEFKDKLRLHI